MSSKCSILILDDGELEELADHLDRQGLAYTRLRGAGIGEDLDPPLDLLVTTTRHASVIGAGDSESKAGALRIVAVSEDSNTVREMLRRLGFDLLVRPPIHSEVWRLLVQRALYQGVERRDVQRLPIGHEVALTGPRSREQALLLDLSEQGCRLLSRCSIPAGTRLSLEISEEDEHEPRHRVRGNVLRNIELTDPQAGWSHSAAVQFDEELLAATNDVLRSLLERPASASDTGARSQIEVVLDSEDLDESAAATDDRDERRRHPRAAFPRAVRAGHATQKPGERSGRTLIGRDLSAGGMRVERIPEFGLGDCFELAIYAPGRVEPFRVQATVLRDDGERGMALRFHDLPEPVASGLEKMVACLPDVEALRDEEADRLGSVISEIVSGS
ncbi:MAG: PilZ domain-containing protein [Myxococcota bacterium]